MEDKIASGLSANGVNTNEFDGFKGTYHMAAGNLTLKIHEGLSLSGKQKLNVEIPLWFVVEKLQKNHNNLNFC